MDIKRRKKTREEMLSQKDKATYSVRRFLEASGWELSMANPACWWLWTKTLPDGRVVLVTEETAVNFQAGLDGVTGELDGE
jgi:hypothetical protein